MAEMTATEDQTDSRQALVRRIESREDDIGVYVQRARRRRDRLSLLGIIAGAVVSLATAGPALGGQGFATTVGNALPGDSSSLVWQTLCVAALLASVAGTIVAGLQRAEDVAGKLATAEASRTELDSLATAVAFQDMPLEEAAEKYRRVTAKLSFVAEL
ncbi:hypothetical protein AB0D57_19920 [Streptomyces sp. NPDC048275]|uniref:hypothetical protein n=1 Tax=Streptomyces sp. NPDC048275 TaxID=3155629 RepID=UPI0033DC7C9A